MNTSSIKRPKHAALFVLLLLCLCPFSAGLRAQQNQPPRPAPRDMPTIPPERSLPPGVGPGAPNFPGAPPMPGAPTFPGAGPMPGAPAGVGARQPPGFDERFATPRQQMPAQPAPAPSGLAALVAKLDAITPFVQAFDFLLMIIAGIACLRARRRRGVGLLAVACFISAIILLGFFSFSITHGHGSFAQIAYVGARLLAPFELLLFAIAIVLVAHTSR